jgi:hypothetical protein
MERKRRRDTLQQIVEKLQVERDLDIDILEAAMDPNG